MRHSQPAGVAGAGDGNLGGLTFFNRPGAAMPRALLAATNSAYSRAFRSSSARSNGRRVTGTPFSNQSAPQTRRYRCGW
jgi:hypothetical protein